jgi:hypothetical protein
MILREPLFEKGVRGDFSSDKANPPKSPFSKGGPGSEDVEIPPWD